MVADTLLANRAYRAAFADRPITMTDGAEPRSHLISDPGATAALDSAEQRIEAVAALGELTERERKIVIWRFYEDRTQSEIGRRLGIGQVQVSRLLRRTLGQLRDVLGEADLDLGAMPAELTR